MAELPNWPSWPSGRAPQLAELAEWPSSQLAELIAWPSALVAELMLGGETPYGRVANLGRDRLGIRALVYILGLLEH